ncbi:MAG: ribonuclease HII, partial [Candidatus Thermoplasmatota archaeon]|nr:ribonuclease HII [Candidatus Thermoplasmatota archaeon]
MICGCDEAGRGPVFGPLVIVGALFEDDSELIKLNVRDSKKITPKRRMVLADMIKKIAV